MIEKIKMMDKKKILLCIEILFYLFCFVKVCLNLCYGMEAMYQTFRDCFNYKAIAYFLAVLLMVRRAKIWHPASIIYSICYVVGSILYFKKWQFEIELYNANMSKCIAFGLFFLLIIDFFVSRNLVKWKERNKVLTVLFAAATIVSAILSPGRSSLIYLVCPFLALYFIRINEKKWKQLIICLSVALWLSANWIMIKSLIDVPYEGGRYWGVFLNLSTIGIFCTSAALSAFSWFLMIKGNDVKANLLRLLSVIAFLIPVYYVMLISARVAQLALILAVLFGCVFWIGKYDSVKIKKRVLIGGIVAVVGIGLFILVLWGLYNIDSEDIKANVENDFLRGQLVYWCGRAKTTFNAKSATFKHGSVLAMMDRFSSGRLGIWFEYSKELTLTGHAGVYCPINGRLHPHNNYMAWLYQYGLIGGSLFLSWFIYLLVCAIKKAGTVRNIKYLFPSLWCVMAIGAMLPETHPWIYTTTFILLFVQYIFIIRISDKEDAENEENGKVNNN